MPNTDMPKPWPYILLPFAPQMGRVRRPPPTVRPITLEWMCMVLACPCLALTLGGPLRSKGPMNPMGSMGPWGPVDIQSDPRNQFVRRHSSTCYYYYSSQKALSRTLQHKCENNTRRQMWQQSWCLTPVMFSWCPRRTHSKQWHFVSIVEDFKLSGPRPQDPPSQLRAAISSNLPQELHRNTEYEAAAGLGCFQLLIFRNWIGLENKSSSNTDHEAM